MFLVAKRKLKSLIKLCKNLVQWNIKTAWQALAWATM